MKEFVFVIIEINGREWGAILKWKLKPWYSRMFSRYKYSYQPFGLSNEVEEQRYFYNKHYSNISFDEK